MERELIAMATALTVAAIQAQAVCYDPTLDPQAVTTQAPTHETWDAHLIYGIQDNSPPTASSGYACRAASVARVGDEAH